jgi:lipopolysaccharide/colanic/teichoic acid biosynthesis glycosyltransferase
MYEWALARQEQGNVITLPEEVVHSGWRQQGYLLGKRITDILLGGLLMLITLPITLAAAVAIKLTSPGPILFCQQRAGQGGRPFPMYKLRSM